MAKKFEMLIGAFFGYLWYFSLYLIIYPFLVIYTGKQLDLLVFNLLFKTEPMAEFLLIPTLIGGLFFIIGLSLAVWATIDLSRQAKCFPFDIIHLREFHPKSLATQRLYKIVRHPMLSGYVLMLLGIAIALTSPMSVLWTIPLFVWAAYEATYYFEEIKLLSWFGEEYSFYRKNVPFIFPNLLKVFKNDLSN